MRTTLYLSGQELAREGETSLGHVHASTWGLYLLTLPLATGSTAPPGRTIVATDSVTSSSAVEMVTTRCAELGATRTLDLQSTSSASYVFPIFLFKSAAASGNAIR